MNFSAALFLALLTGNATGAYIDSLAESTRRTHRNRFEFRSRWWSGLSSQYSFGSSSTNSYTSSSSSSSGGGGGSSFSVGAFASSDGTDGASSSSSASADSAAAYSGAESNANGESIGDLVIEDFMGLERQEMVRF